MIYDTLFEGDEDFHRCKIIAIDGEGMYFVKLLDYGFTKKVNKVYPDSADHSGPDWVSFIILFEIIEMIRFTADFRLSLPRRLTRSATRS